MAFVDLDTIHIPRAGSNYPVATWGKQVNDNFNALKAEVDARSTVTNAAVTTTGNVAAAGNIDADGYIRAGLGFPRWRVQQFGGTLDANGEDSVATNIGPVPNGNRILFADAWYKGNGGESIRIRDITVDGSAMYVWAGGYVAGGGSANKPWVGCIAYTEGFAAW